MLVQEFQPTKTPAKSKAPAKAKKRPKLNLEDQYEAIKVLRKAVHLAEQKRNRSRQ
jgi:hypothetical protein